MLSSPARKLKKMHEELTRLTIAYQREVEVVIVSDNKTHIIVRGVGQVGKTTRRTIKLRPGKRLLEGSRAGYQSKLVSIEIAPDAKNLQVVLICDEKI